MIDDTAAKLMARMLVGGAVIALAIALLVGILIGRAASHEWYPTECCSGHDCTPAAPGRIGVTAQGYVVDGRFTVPFAEARRSLDGRYHVCFPAPDTLRCLFVPPAGS